MSKILRHETLFGNLIPINDASHLISEKQTNQEIKIFKIDEILNKDSVFIGFGKPNVFLAFEHEGNTCKFDAKSLKRKKSEMVDTRNWAQSGLLFNLLNLPDNAKYNIKKSVNSFTGSSHWTCVNSNCRVLNRAGFTSGGQDLSKFYFPMSLAKQIIRHGLEFQGNKVEVEIIKTVPNYLESFGISVIKSQWSTFYRHSKRYFKNLSKKYPFWKLLNTIKHSIFDRFKKLKDNKIEDVVTLFPEHITSDSYFELSISKPSKIGLLGRYIWGPHAFYQIKQDPNYINKLLPTKLIKYEAKKNTFFNFLKKNVLFNETVCNFINKHLAYEKEIFNNCTEKELFNMLRTSTDNKPHRYNLVITQDSISVIKIGIKYKIIDWILSKHILLSDKSTDVRFAGEFWKESDGSIYFNNDSGTYAPDTKTVIKTEILLKSIFQNINIISVPF
jgi:hypothetical protein